MPEVLLQDAEYRSCFETILRHDMRLLEHAPQYALTPDRRERADPVPAQIAPEWLLRLSGAELARAERFVRLPDRLSYLAAHLLLQVALDAYCAEQARWRYATDRYGKPYLVSPRQDIHFNLSHTDGYVAVALSRRGPVGVDIESDTRAVTWLSTDLRPGSLPIPMFTP